MKPAFALSATGLIASALANDLVSDISVISGYWGQIRPYADNEPGHFGVEALGLPNGCGIEQVHQLQRHGARYPTSATEDGVDDQGFAAKVSTFLAAGGKFTGPLSFLSGYQQEIDSSGLLVETGAAQLFTSGTQFWNLYGRLLYGAKAGQPYYNASNSDGTARTKPVLRTTSQARIFQSAIFWAQGFFGYQTNVSDLYDLVVIPEGGTENNTLASYDSCFNDDLAPLGILGDNDVFTYIPLYLQDATARLQQYVDGENFTLTVNDTYSMQSICAYEYNSLGSSDFCGLFTLDEWKGFEYTLDLEYYYDYSYGNPTGRAQGLGYLEELLARLQKQFITSSDSSVNSTLDNNGATFPLGQPFYLDTSHDDIIISVLTAMSLDYLKPALPLDVFPPPEDRTFVLSHLTPFGGRLTTEVIGCASANPTAKQYPETTYKIYTNGYDPTKAPNKFIRMRLNQGVLPLNTIRGGFCTREDGLCSLCDFLASQTNMTQLANYQYSCFANQSEVLANFNWDGSSFPQ
ncbi:phosphoglycerate mutase-like protein [Dacryopinax primogenitus]|uniref:Phosphoglycerate mutase-like protein n=1 Tax=Dacryopinax primogenitus (strain DJM 731) TaxID=1858805 RepID=M5G9J8_DACPD|nr:phosphoglycerate mutase-like protein [Dacryopinax primogenitus]EJU00483.1 phosphoglycerate mutase-like protein [Dacryopinax primogenitus]